MALQLPEHLTILEISEWQEAMGALLAVSPELQIDVSPLTRIDTAGLQLLLAVVQEAQAKGGSVQWVGVSDILSQSAHWLGMSSVLGVS